MINLDDVRNFTEVGTGYTADKMLNMCADEIHFPLHKRPHVCAVTNDDSVVSVSGIFELYANHPTKHDAARMARVRCLIEIGEQK